MTSIKQTLIDRSIPQHIKSDYPLFSLFMEAYYEFCESQGHSIEYVKNLKDYRNVDTTLTEFLNYFQQQYINKFPQRVLADKKLLIKNVKSFYINKGNQQSYKFLFKVLYDEDISIYFPGDDVLRASDGKWVTRTALKILIDSVADIKDKEGLFIVGQTSGASAGIESIIVYEDRGSVVAEIDISNISGTFVDNEIVEIGDDEFQTIECYSSATVTTPGSKYAIGDILPIHNSSGDSIGISKVVSTTRGTISGLVINAAGENYNGNTKLVDDFSYLPINYTWDSMVLNNTPIYDVSGYDFSVEPINFTIDVEEFLGVGDFIDITDSSNSSGSGAFGVVDSVDKDGAILSVLLVNSGDQYESPTATVLSDTGSGSSIGVLGGGGGIRKVKLETFPRAISGESGVYVDTTSRGDGTAVIGLGSSTIVNYPGYWLNEDGQLSSNKKLQDNYFYQDFSYVIRVSKSIQEWSDYIKDIIHPLGTRVFGEIEITSKASLNIQPIYSLMDFEFNFDIDLSIGVEDFELTIISSNVTWADNDILTWGDATEAKWSGPPT